LRGRFSSLYISIVITINIARPHNHAAAASFISIPSFLGPPEYVVGWYAESLRQLADFACPQEAAVAVFDMAVPVLIPSFESSDDYAARALSP